MDGRELLQSKEGVYNNHSQSQAASEWMLSFEGRKNTRCLFTRSMCGIDLESASGKGSQVSER